MHRVHLGGVHLEDELDEWLQPLERIDVGGRLAGDGLDELEDLAPVPAPAVRLALQLLDEELLA